MFVFITEIMQKEELQENSRGKLLESENLLCYIFFSMSHGIVGLLLSVRCREHASHIVLSN